MVEAVPSLQDPDTKLTAAVTTQFETYFERSDLGGFFDESGLELKIVETDGDSLWMAISEIY